MKLNYIEFRNFRSFGNEWVRIENPSKINIFIGPNNSGKTNILRFVDLMGKVKDQLRSVRWGQEIAISGFLSADDFYKFQNQKIEIKICFDLEKNEQDVLYGVISPNNLYVQYDIQGDQLKLSRTSINDITNSASLGNFLQKWAHSHGGGIPGGPLEDMQAAMNNYINLTKFVSLPGVILVPEYRKLAQDKHLRTELKKIIHPTYLDKIRQEPRKRALYGLLEVILGAKCDISIPDIEREIEIEINGFQQSLSSVGAGVQELLLLGFYLATQHNVIFCIDELETHLHPAAQRKILDYMANKTDNTYYVATHSNNFLDFTVKDKSIYVVRKEKDDTQIDKAENNTAIRNALDDLGIRASEIYQANGIIWVEGPSDRIYIKKWLEMKCPDYQEGLNYAFQYYGGKILSHYSLNDVAFEEYLNILKINRNAYVVMDSDKEEKYEEKDLRDTKQRIIKECKENNIGYWVTEGREVENYLSDNLLSKFKGQVIKRDIYKPIKDYLADFEKKSKVDFAREFVKTMTVEEFSSNYNLSEKIDEIIVAIKSWNQ